MALTDACAESKLERLTTREGWNAYVRQAPLSCALLPYAEFAKLDAAAREAHNEQRFDYHSELVIAETPTLRQVIHLGRVFTIVNRRERGARRGVIVKGVPASGKSTALIRLGKQHQLYALARRPNPGDWQPVLYVIVPPKRGGSRGTTRRSPGSKRVETARQRRGHRGRACERAARSRDTKRGYLGKEVGRRPAWAFAASRARPRETDERVR